MGIVDYSILYHISINLSNVFRMNFDNILQIQQNHVRFRHFNRKPKGKIGKPHKRKAPHGGCMVEYEKVHSHCDGSDEKQGFSVHFSFIYSKIFKISVTRG